MKYLRVLTCSTLLAALVAGCGGGGGGGGGGALFVPSTAEATSASSTAGNTPSSTASNTPSRTASDAASPQADSNSPVPSYFIGGTVAGLVGGGLVLQNNAGDDIALTGNGAFRFPKPVTTGLPYAVTVKAQPTGPNQTCSVNQGNGTVGDAAVGNVTVMCSTNGLSVGGTVTGLAGKGLVLQNNAGDDLLIAANGTFRFPALVAYGAGYAVTVKTQPGGPAQVCSVTDAGAPALTADVRNVKVVCSTQSYSIGGTVSGMRGSGLVLQNNGGDDLIVNADGTFQFAKTVASGANYMVTVKTQTKFPNEFCTVARRSGPVTNAGITDVTVECIQSAPAAPSSIRLQSDSGDYVGGGKNYTYSRTNASLMVFASGPLLWVRVTGDETWLGMFMAPNSTTELPTGSFPNLRRLLLMPPAGGLDWGGEGRGCNALTGSMYVSKVSYVNDTLTEVDMSFEQHCEGFTPALRGQIHWTAYDNSVAPGPINPPPSGLWEPAAGATPSTGNYIYLASDAGDYIGAGSTYLFTPDTSPVTFKTNAGTLSVDVGGWNATFQTMDSVTQLQPGYYGSLLRYPFNNPTKGGLDWSGNGRGCNTLQGWFVVDGATYIDTVLKSIDLRFEQHCGGSAPALRGKVHWLF